MTPGCPLCDCTTVEEGGAHALQGMLASCDIDAAIEHGLLTAKPCDGCDTRCNARLIAARDDRLCALQARERHRVRAARLQRRKAEREAARTPPATLASTAPALPTAAADALARALAKARAGRSQ
jgi:hypothetical protein